jgi:uncharacterized repeat protein (TIGR01451 family)
VAAAGVPNQNFGLFHGSRITGRVFADLGSGEEGVANDGIRNGGETGIPGVPVQVTNADGSSILDTTVTDASGGYVLYVSGISAPLKIIQTNLPAYVSTGASAGTTAGTYDRASDTVSFTLVADASHSGVDFGDVPVSTLAPDNALAGLPGTTLYYPHVFTAGSAGEVTFSLASAAGGESGTFTETLYRDNNCDGKLDSGEPILAGAIGMATGETLCLVLEEFIPAAAPADAQNKIVLSAHYALLNAMPALNSIYSRTDLTTVGEPQSAGLRLSKAVNKSTALPGDTLVYTITFVNNSSSPLSNLVVNDSTPAYTRYLGGACGTPLPAGITACSISTQPPMDGTGAIQWTLTGSVAPGSSGTLIYSVRLE